MKNFLLSLIVVWVVLPALAQEEERTAAQCPDDKPIRETKVIETLSAFSEAWSTRRAQMQEILNINGRALYDGPPSLSQTFAERHLTEEYLRGEVPWPLFLYDPQYFTFPTESPAEESSLKHKEGYGMNIRLIDPVDCSIFPVFTESSIGMLFRPEHCERLQIFPKRMNDVLEEYLASARGFKESSEQFKRDRAVADSAQEACRLESEERTRRAVLITKVNDYIAGLQFESTELYILLRLSMPHTEGFRNRRLRSNQELQSTLDFYDDYDIYINDIMSPIMENIDRMRVYRAFLLKAEFDVRLAAPADYCPLVGNRQSRLEHECIRFYFRLTEQNIQFRDFLIRERDLLEGYLCELPNSQLNGYLFCASFKNTEFIDPTVYRSSRFYRVSDYIESYESLREDLDESFPNYEQTRERIDENLIRMRAYKEDMRAESIANQGKAGSPLFK